MSMLPRVTEQTRERISREFDDLGPQAWVAEIIRDLQRSNPEILDMATKCARDVGEPEKILVGFCMFYRLLAVESAEEHAKLKETHSEMGEMGMSPPLPRVTADTRDRIVQEIDEKGPPEFTTDYLAHLGQDNPELLQMAHRFAARHAEYLRIMQGVALLWAALISQLKADRTVMH